MSALFEAFTKISRQDELKGGKIDKKEEKKMDNKEVMKTSNVDDIKIFEQLINELTKMIESYKIINKSDQEMLELQKGMIAELSIRLRKYEAKYGKEFTQ